MCNGVRRPIARLLTIRPLRPSSSNSTPSSPKWRISRATRPRHPRPAFARAERRVGLHLAGSFRWDRHLGAAAGCGGAAWLTHCRCSRPGLAGSAATRFRVGMTLPVDPSPFLLAAGLTKVQPLEGSGMISVEVVGLLRDGAALLHRLYLPGGKVILPAPSRRRWSTGRMPLLLSTGRGHPGGQPRVGSVARSGRRHDRMAVLSDQGRQDVRTRLGAGQQPGSAAKNGGNAAIRRPRRATPIADDALRRPYRRHAARPETEYILVSAIDATGQAWVEIDAGIDINPAGLTLPSVPLAA